MVLERVHQSTVWRAGTRHQQLADALLALSLVAVSLAVLQIGASNRTPRNPVAVDLVAVGTAVLVLTVRRWRTRTALAVTVVTATLYIAGGYGLPAFLGVALVVVFYTFSSTTDRRTVWVSAGIVAAILCLAAAVWGPSEWRSAKNLGLLAWIGMPAAFGDAIRSRRAYVAEIEERARRAELARDEEARLRVVKERLRIARELHDVVAHHIAVIKVQASGAKHVLAHSPDQVGPALEHISRSADTALTEMASVVGLLRDTHDPRAEQAPVSGLRQLPGLLAERAAAGLTIDFRQHGTVRGLPALVDLTAYRIAQEALTNAAKYGDGAAYFRVDYTARGVRLEITNRIGPPVTGGLGYGIVGMRERAAAVGGTLSVGALPSGEFVVDAELIAAGGADCAAEVEAG